MRKIVKAIPVDRLLFNINYITNIEQKMRCTGELGRAWGRRELGTDGRPFGFWKKLNIIHHHLDKRQQRRPMSLLRKACFTIINGQPDDANAAPQTYRNPELVAYTKSFCRKIETRKDEDSDDLNDLLRTHDRESNVGDSQQEFEANDSPKNDSNETNKKDEAVLPMDKCVKLLEPHLVGFRKKYEGTLTKEPTGDATDDITDFIPQQLIRMTRFFPFKWIPLKLALLRSPSRDEV